jgi:hypothetical protein
LNEDCLPTEVALCCMNCMSASYYAENNQYCQQNTRKNQPVHRSNSNFTSRMMCCRRSWINYQARFPQDKVCVRYHPSVSVWFAGPICISLLLALPALDYWVFSTGMISQASAIGYLPYLLLSALVAFPICYYQALQRYSVRQPHSTSD